MNKNKFFSITIFVVLLLGLLTFIPNVSAASVGILENFSEYDVGSKPCLPTPIFFDPCNGLDGNRYSVSGSAFNTVDTPFGHDFAFQPTVASNGAQAQFDTHHNLCENPTGDGFVISIGSNGANPQYGTLLQLMGKFAGNPLVVSQRVYSVFFDFPGPSPTFGRATLSVQNYQNNVFVGGSTAAPIIYTTVSFAANQLYTFKILCPATSASGTMTIISLDSGATSSTSVPANVGANYVNDNIWSAQAGDDVAKPIQLYDEVTYHYSIPGISPTATSATYANGIAGFDITKDGTAVIVRTNNPTTGQDVRVLNGDSLIESVNTPIATQCNRLHGVVGLGDDGFGYIHCASGSSPDSMRFISSTGGTYPTGCNNSGQVCDGAFALTAAIPETNRNALSDVVPAIPGILKKTSQQGSDYHELNYYSLVFTESAGLNVDAADFNYQYINPAVGLNVNGEQLTADIAVDGSSLPDTCGFGNLRVFTAHSGIPVKGFTVTNSYPNIDNVIPSIENTFNGTSGALLTAAHIDCANDRIITTTATQLTIWNYATDTLVFTNTITPTNAVVAFNTISGNGTYAAYSDGTLTHIINGLTGTDLATITNPGTLFDMEMDQCGQKLFLATTTTPKVYEYDITPYTTITPVSIGNGTCIISSGIGSSSSGSTTDIVAPTPTEPSLTGVCIDSYVCDSGGNPNHFWFGLNKTQMASDFNITEGKFNWLLAFLVIIVVALVVFLFISKSPLVLSLVVLAALGLCVALGTVPIWFLLTTIFIIIVVSVRSILGGGEE